MILPRAGNNKVRGKRRNVISLVCSHNAFAACDGAYTSIVNDCFTFIVM